MKNLTFFLFAGIVLLCSCEKSEELPDAVAFSKVPETNIAEKLLGVVKYSHEDLVSVTSGIYYDWDAVYDCYKKGGKTYYIMNRRENRPNNANLLVGMDGFLPDAIQIHDGYYEYLGGLDGDVVLYNYKFDEESQALDGIFRPAHFIGHSNILIYLSEEYLILQTDLPWLGRSAEKGATFSRTVYKRCTELNFKMPTDTVDWRK